MTQSRHKRTLRMVESNIPKTEKILDLGYHNPFSDNLRRIGYLVENTNFDLDRKPDFLLNHKYQFDCAVAFEVLEHLLNPYNVLQQIPCRKLLLTVPLNVWFSSAYWNSEDVLDQHFHEFEVRQFNKLLINTGWKIVHSEKWWMGFRSIGIRPILRLLWPSYYFVKAIRK